MVDSVGQLDQQVFLSRLAVALSATRGVGPTTRKALERFRRNGVVRAAGGRTNGAAMRMVPVGWATPIAADQPRRQLAIGLAEVTHGEPVAITTACIIAAMGSAAIEASSPVAAIEAGMEELAWWETTRPFDPDAFRSV